MIVAGTVNGAKPAWRVRLVQKNTTSRGPFSIIATGETEADAIADALGRASKFFGGAEFKALEASRTL